MVRLINITYSFLSSIQIKFLMLLFVHTENETLRDKEVIFVLWLALILLPSNLENPTQMRIQGCQETGQLGDHPREI